tara:strand:- start:201 stop:461 length:261 start_codon:yes stop_codon:yes gene_type:complete
MTYEKCCEAAADRFNLNLGQLYQLAQEACFEIDDRHLLEIVEDPVKAVCAICDAICDGINSDDHFANDEGEMICRDCAAALDLDLD